jgi:hypothetical protein
MWIFFNTAFAFVTAAVGLLGVGAVLDSSMPESRKRKVARWASVRVEHLRRHELGGARLFAVIFGEKYISRRSLIVSVAISATSISIFYLVAHLTSDSAVQHMIFPIRKQIDLLGWITLGVYVPVILACDFLSYAQTRLFLSYIDKLNSFTVSGILYIADMMFSVVLFVCGYAFARAIVTVIVATSHYAAPFERSTTISPDVVTATYRAFVGNKLLSDATSLKVAGVDVALKAHRAAPSAATEKALITETLRLQYDDISKLGGAVAGARLTCLRDLSLGRENQTRLFEILKESDRLVLDKIGLPNMSIDFGGRAPFYQYLSVASLADGPCPIYAVSARVRIEPKAAISKVTWFEYFLGALAATINELNYAIFTKMSAFPSDDPVSQAPLVLSYAVAASNSPPFGIGATRDGASSPYFLNDIDTGSVRLPLGPLAASSLAANLIFGLYVLAGCSVAAAARLFEVGWATRILKVDAVFVRISIGLVAVILMFAATLFIVDNLFDGLIRLAIMKPLGP